MILLCFLAAAMATQKHLHELLEEDQEPFYLKNYISDKRYHLKRSNLYTKPTSIQVKKRDPIMETSRISASKRNICQHACFLSFHPSPDVTNSPVPSFLSPVRSPCRTPNGIGNGSVFLHIPARTAALLLEAAMKIQKQQYPLNSKPKSQIKNLGFGLFSSILKKLKDRKRSKNSVIGYGEVQNSRRSVTREEILGAKGVSNVALFGSCSRRSSAGWSESNEERRSLGMETSTSSFRSENSEEIDFVDQDCENSGSGKRFCSSPHSPFRFSVHSPSSGQCTPDSSSPAASPTRRNEQRKENSEVNSLENYGNEEVEEKEQCSPVSVLDPPFENKDDEHECLDEDDYDVECSFAIVKRAKEKLLYKLCRFEKLAELDPIELEKRLMEEEETEEEEEICAHIHMPPAHRRCDIEAYVKQVLTKADLSLEAKVPRYMERLVSDLIIEEEKSYKWLDDEEILVERVCRKLECWKEVELNTIDMMAEVDFKNEVDQWKSYQEQREETRTEIEVAIFGILLQDLTDELENSKVMR